jgi:hypothetical protein
MISLTRTGKPCYRSALDGVHLVRSGPGGCQRENTGARAEVEDDVAGFHRFGDRRQVCLGSPAVVEERHVQTERRRRARIGRGARFAGRTQHRAERHELLDARHEIDPVSQPGDTRPQLIEQIRQRPRTTQRVQNRERMGTTIALSIARADSQLVVGADGQANAGSAPKKRAGIEPCHDRDLLHILARTILGCLLGILQSLLRAP